MNLYWRALAGLVLSGWLLISWANLNVLVHLAVEHAGDAHHEHSGAPSHAGDDSRAEHEHWLKSLELADAIRNLAPQSCVIALFAVPLPQWHAETDPLLVQRLDLPPRIPSPVSLYNRSALLI
jgi:hypothetical protein